MLTSEPDEFEKHLKENSSQLTKEEKNRPESYAYGEVIFANRQYIYIWFNSFLCTRKIGKFLLRSQLDCFDPKLPRGTFDLKTRAVMPVRLDIQNYAVSVLACYLYINTVLIRFVRRNIWAIN